MQTDDVILTVSSFAGGRDLAVGAISLSAREALLFWVAERRLEHRQISEGAWFRLGMEAGTGYVPRRLPAGSALVTALFGARRTAMSAEYVARFSMPRPDSVTIHDSLENLLTQVAVSIAPAPAAAGAEQSSGRSHVLQL